MTKRDLISEIAEIRNRHGDISNIWSHFNKRFAIVLDGYMFLEANDSKAAAKELLKYIPIASVACLEQYFRHWASRIIDGGGLYISNIRRFSFLNFNHDAIIALHNKSITLGEFLAHQLPLNTLDDINSAFTKLLFTDESGKSFLEEIKTIELSAESLKIKCDGGVIKSIKELYRLRHIFCHEIAAQEQILAKDACNLYVDAMYFSICADHLFSKLIKAA